VVAKGQRASQLTPIHAGNAIVGAYLPPIERIVPSPQAFDFLSHRRALNLPSRFPRKAMSKGTPMEFGT
jgi:hypothetical protein